MQFEPNDKMPPEELQWLGKLTASDPSAGNFQKMASALVWNGNPDEARQWLRKACKLVSVSQCVAVKEAWANQALQDPRVAAVPWPE